jgi:hypothetical protein
VATLPASPPQFAPQAYDEVLRELKLHDFAGVTPQSLRLGYIHKSIGDAVYRSPAYYGLDIFAMTMYARSYYDAEHAASEGAGHRAAELSSQALAAFKQMQASIDASWFQFPGKAGFFSPTYNLLSAEKDAGLLVKTDQQTKN